MRPLRYICLIGLGFSSVMAFNLVLEPLNAIALPTCNVEGLKETTANKVAPAAVRSTNNWR